MTGQPLPARIQRMLEDELVPVRPLAPPWRRLLGVAAVTAVIAVLALTTLELRFDLGEIPMWLSWGCSGLQLAIGVTLVGLALREAIPGTRVPTVLAGLSLAGGVLVHALVGVATWLHSPVTGAAATSLGAGVGCLGHDLVMALPIMGLALWLVFRALPTRAPVAGLLGGAGAALTADAIIHLHCPMSDLRHVMVWHTGALLLAMAVGWLAGVLWERRRWRA